MNPFSYQRASSIDDAIHAITAPNAKFLGGGTNLIDLMKDNVEHPATLVDVTHLDAAATVTPTPLGGLMIGALVRNSDLANHPRVVSDYPLLSQALLAGASPQLRNMATTAGNLLQRPRCSYFMDTTFPACNKRMPGTGCAAITGIQRYHAILGQTDKGAASAESCIATNPSDMNVAMAALNASVHVQGPKSAKRVIPIAEFHRLPGTNPATETTLRPDELITAIELPAPTFSANSWYLKVRDRQSYAFALVSAGVGLQMSGGSIQSAAIVLGGVAHKPWRSAEADRSLSGQQPSPEAFRRAADLALTGARGYEHNTFKIEMARQTIVRALSLAARGSQAGSHAA